MSNSNNSYNSEPLQCFNGTKQMLHEQATLRENHSFAYQCRTQELKQEQDILRKKIGWLGRTFGTSENASKNITAFLCTLIVIVATILSIVVYCCSHDFAYVLDIWNLVIPLISLSLGYLFGKR